MSLRSAQQPRYRRGPYGAIPTKGKKQGVLCMIRMGWINGEDTHSDAIPNSYDHPNIDSVQEDWSPRGLGYMTSPGFGQRKKLAQSQQYQSNSAAMPWNYSPTKFKYLVKPHLVQGEDTTLKQPLIGYKGSKTNNRSLIKDLTKSGQQQPAPINEYLDYGLSQDINEGLKEVKKLADQIKGIKKAKREALEGERARGILGARTNKENIMRVRVIVGGGAIANK